MASAERCPSPGPPLSLIVSLQTAYEVHQCGGTLVAEDWVLTSAQCLDPLPVYAKFGLRDLGADINDINGDAYGVRYLNCVLGRRVTGMVRHPGYNWRTLENDVALLRVASLSRVEMASAFVPLVALAGARANFTAPEYFSAGWGAEGYISGANADVAAIAASCPALEEVDLSYCVDVGDSAVAALASDGAPCSWLWPRCSRLQLLLAQFSRAALRPTPDPMTASLHPLSLACIEVGDGLLHELLTEEAISARFRNMHQAFQYIDVDKSGSISTEELVTALKKWSTPVEPYA